MRIDVTITSGQLKRPVQGPISTFQRNFEEWPERQKSWLADCKCVSYRSKAVRHNGIVGPIDRYIEANIPL